MEEDRRVEILNGLLGLSAGGRDALDLRRGEKRTLTMRSLHKEDESL